jgi:hypothetical protein
MHKFLFYNNFIIFLYAFRALLCSSSGGQIVLIQHLVSALSVGDRPVHRYDMFEKFLSFSMRSRRSMHTFLLFIGDNFWDQLGTNFLHAQFERQNFVDGLAIQIQHTTDHSDRQTSIRPHEIPHFGHIFVRF